MPTNAALVRALGSVLDANPDAPTLPELLHLVDEYVVQAPATLEERVAQTAQLEEEMVSLHVIPIDYSSIHKLEVLLAFQYHLLPIMTPTAVISLFDPVLRPALREPQLSTASLNHAKELIILTLQKTQEPYSERVGQFRRRLLELYLLDAYNEVSGLDVLEWAGLSEDERDRRTRWKANLQDILVAYGHEVPEAFLTEVDRQFQVPSQRLQLLMLLNEFTSSLKFDTIVPVFADHDLMKSLANCLFLDNSSTVCTALAFLVVKLLPYFAVHARTTLKENFPQYLAIMARIMCWKERPPVTENPLAKHDKEFERELYGESSRKLHIRPDLDWERLEMTFSVEPSLPPSSRQYFTILYYLYPSNVVRFIRTPVAYLEDRHLRSPYLESWAQAFDVQEIKRKSENFVREHILHPFLIWSNAEQEMSKPAFWANYDVGRIVSEAGMLDIRNLSIGAKERYELEGKKSVVTSCDASSTPTGTGGGSPNEDEPVRLLRPIDLSSGKAVIYIQDMVEASVALKSNIDLEILKPTSSIKSGFMTRAFASAGPSTPPNASSDGDSSTHVAQAISGLQREVLLLRNELNFELWHSRENSKHIGRLYKDRILMRTAESERQGLYNKLRRYRAQVIALEKELRDHKETAANAKNGYADWAKELQGKLKDLREEKKKMAADLSNAQTSERELKALFEAQGKRLDEALQENFILQAQKKESVHKIEKSEEHEHQIEELTKARQIWEDDSRKFAEREEDLNRLRGENEALHTRIQELERARDDEAAREYRAKIQSLELRLAQMEEISAELADQQLADENTVLKTEIEELQSTIATLKQQ